MISAPSLFPVCLCWILLVWVLVIVIKSCKYLSCKKTLEIENKHVYVHIISNKNKKKNEIIRQKVIISYSLYTRYATITSLMFYFMSIILSFYAQIKIITTSTMDRPLQIVAFGLWFNGRILMNSIFVQRLKSSFAGTDWMYSNMWFKYLYILLLTIACLGIIAIIILIFQGIVFYEIVNFIGMINFSVMGILDISCSIILTILFQRKIFELIKSYFNIFKNRIKEENIRQEQERNNLLQLNINNNSIKDESSNPTQSVPSISLQTISISPTNKDVYINTDKSPKKRKNGILRQHLISDSIVLNDMNIDEIRDKSKTNKILKLYDHKRLELINNITQYMILIFISLITSLSFIVISASIIYQTNYENRINGWFYFLFILSIDDFMNSLCLYLHFPFSLKLYKFICGHKFCLHKCTLLTLAKCIN